MLKWGGGGLRWVFLLAILGVLLGGLVVGGLGGSWLVVDRPAPGDAIVVLAGETERRPTRGLELLAKGMAPRMFLDAPAGNRIYGKSQLELAQQYLRELPEAGRLAACPIVGLSTRDEARDVVGCLALLRTPIHRVLLVTSDFHTRRALAIFRHEIPGVEFNSAAAYDSAQFGTRWWQHRQWAKTFFDECARLTWWYAVDRWRK